MFFLRKVFLLTIIVIICFSFSLESKALFKFKKKANQTQNAQQVIKKEEVKKEKKKEKAEIVKEKEIIIIEIYAKWCPLCKNIEPTLDLLQSQLTDIKFVKFDVSTQDTSQKSEETARKLGLYQFYQANKNKTSTVAIIVPSTREIVSTYYNEDDLDKYKTSIQEAKEKEKMAQST